MFGISAAEGQNCVHSQVDAHPTVRLTPSYSLPSNLGIVQQHHQGLCDPFLGVGGAFSVSKWSRLLLTGMGRQLVLISCIVITAVYVSTMKCMSPPSPSNGCIGLTRTSDERPVGPPPFTFFVGCYQTAGSRIIYGDYVALLLQETSVTITSFPCAAAHSVLFSHCWSDDLASR